MVGVGEVVFMLMQMRPDCLGICNRSRGLEDTLSADSKVLRAVIFDVVQDEFNDTLKEGVPGGCRDIPLLKFPARKVRKVESPAAVGASRAVVPVGKDVLIAGCDGVEGTGYRALYVEVNAANLVHQEISEEIRPGCSIERVD